MNQEFETYDASDQLKTPSNMMQDTSSVSGVVFNERKNVKFSGRHGIITEWVMRCGIKNEKAAQAMLIVFIVILFALTLMVISNGPGNFSPKVIRGAI
ncbi:MAG: hypothetical protein WCT49_04745 [Candidatus Paceibacterota bacterium]|jgi:hypothetical protein|nr:hypothetical protein [Candidatus Paceibacterota bacterium]